MKRDEQAIIRKVLNGDREAYAILVTTHAERVRRLAFRIAGNEADAEDVVQESFLRAYQRLGDFESRSDFGTWVYRIAVNCALSLVARRKDSCEMLIAEEPAPEQHEVQVADGGAGPERLLLSREIDRMHRQAMDSLTPHERTAFVLRHVEECSTEEMAAALGVAPNAARQMLFRAVKKLRRGMAALRTHA